jgi:pyridoxal phosphate enzyme (YggS family)
MLLENTSIILKKISHAAMRAGRNPEEIKLIAVTKTVNEDMIRKAVDIGLRIFGENRVQEAKQKIQLLQEYFIKCHFNIQWHLIGHLQKNKVKFAVQLFDLIHTLNSLELAEEINKYAERTGKIQKVLIQVKLSDEATKHGIAQGGLSGLLDGIKSLKYIELLGLMTMPPYFQDPEGARPYFRRLREIRDFINSEGHYLPELSMGMSNDFQVAIEEGATLVRIGTAIFGERQ